MAFAFQVGTKRWMDSLLSIVLKMGLATATWVPNRDDDFLELAIGTDFGSGELGAIAGYTPGFGGAGRKTLASKAVTIDDTTDRVRFTSGNPSWTALGPGSGGPTIAAACVLEETGGADTASLPHLYNDLTTPITVNGGDFTLTCPANGWVYAQD